MPHLLVLGPQRLKTTVHDVTQEMGIDGDIALISAGWQEREEEDEELRDVLGMRCSVHNLRVHARCEQVYQEDPDLFQAHRKRQDRLKQLQTLYRHRLNALLDSARFLLNHQGEDGLVGPEREDAIQSLRRLDQHHISRLQTIHGDFEAEWQTDARPAVLRQREEIKQQISNCTAVAVAGGHVAVLLNRMRMLGVDAFFEGRHLLAWSAGAMALSERVVLFHDRPPQGPGSPEVLDLGFGCLPGLLPLPHARRRLNLNDTSRVGLLAQRFAPALCVALDEGSRMEACPDGWLLHPATRHLHPDGHVEGFREPMMLPFPAPKPLLPTSSTDTPDQVGDPT